MGKLAKFGKSIFKLIPESIGWEFGKRLWK